MLALMLGECWVQGFEEYARHKARVKGTSSIKYKINNQTKWHFLASHPYSQGNF
jgi:hypothetical protein